MLRWTYHGHTFSAGSRVTSSENPLYQHAPAPTVFIVTNMRQAVRNANLVGPTPERSFPPAIDASSAACIRPLAYYNDLLMSAIQMQWAMSSAAVLVAAY